MDITTQENGHNDSSRIYKIAGLAIASLGLQVWVWWLIKMALYGHRDGEYWLGVVAAMLLWVSFFSFFAIVNYSRWLFLGILLSGLIAYAALFPQDIFVWSGGAVFVVLLWLFRNRLKSLEKHQSHFSLRQLVGGSVIIITYAFLLLLGFNIYYNTSKEFKDNPQQFYDKLGQSAAKSFEFSAKVPGNDFNLHQSLDEFLVKQVGKTNPGQNFDLTAAREELLKRFGVQASGSEPISQILARAATERVKESAKGYEKYFPLLFTVIVLALLRTFAFAFYWLSIIVSWVLFKLMLAFKLFKISKVQVEVDKLEI